MDDKPLNNNEMLDSSDNFEVAYQAHAKSIYKFLFWRTHNVQLSEDLTSSTFEKAWTARRRFKGGSVQAWLYRIARNTLIDHWRKHKELNVEDIDAFLPDSRPATAELIDKKLQLDKLQNAMDKLPDEMQMVVTQRFIEGLPAKQVGKNLDLSENNVRVIQYRALKKLKEYLK